MPYVSISTARGILDTAQKRQLLERVTDLMVEIEGQGNEEFRKIVWVKLEEQDPEHWSLGGMVSSREQVAKHYGQLSADGTRVTKAPA